jgi:uncharacterized protein
VGLIAGLTAAVTGFGIGSFLTPVFAFSGDTKIAVAAVAIPHVIGTALRFWRLRAHVDRSLLRNFGLWSATGGLAGAALHTRLDSLWLSWIFGVLLVLAGISGLTRFLERFEFLRRHALLDGFISGLFGGLVGNQGGIRSAAMLSFDLAPVAFVATATAVGLMVDAVRMPFYLWSEGDALLPLANPISFATGGVVAGTVLGLKLLPHIPKRVFGNAVSVLVLLLGIYFLLRTAG